MSAIAIENLNVKFGNSKVLKGVDLQVQHGEIVVLMGLSGSGKSTLLRTINGLQLPCVGSVRIALENAHIDIANCGAKMLRQLRQYHVAMVFQNFALLPWLNVVDNVSFGLHLRGESKDQRREKAQAWLDKVGLTKCAELYPAQLSGGMQQRVGLARAFATDARILLMDEPFSALDPLIRRELQDELISLQKECGKTIVFVSHDVGEAFRLGSRVALLHQGAIMQIDTPMAFQTNPATPFVRDFITAHH